MPIEFILNAKTWRPPRKFFLSPFLSDFDFRPLFSSIFSHQFQSSKGFPSSRQFKFVLSLFLVRLFVIFQHQNIKWSIQMTFSLFLANHFNLIHKNVLYIIYPDQQRWLCSFTGSFCHVCPLFTGPSLQRILCNLLKILCFFEKNKWLYQWFRIYANTWTLEYSTFPICIYK